MKAKKIVEEFKKERQVNRHTKYMIRAFMLPISGFFLLLIVYTTYFAPFAFILGGYYLAKWRFNIDNPKEEKEYDTETGETVEVEHSSNQWRNTDNGY